MNGFQTQALTFNFNDYRLDPGKYLVVASNAEAFSYRYGLVDALIGTFEDGKLSDSVKRFVLKLILAAPQEFDGVSGMNLMVKVHP